MLVFVLPPGIIPTSSISTVPSWPVGHSHSSKDWRGQHGTLVHSSRYCGGGNSRSGDGSLSVSGPVHSGRSKLRSVDLRRSKGRSVHIVRTDVGSGNSRPASWESLAAREALSPEEESPRSVVSVVVRGCCGYGSSNQKGDLEFVRTC